MRDNSFCRSIFT